MPGLDIWTIYDHPTDWPEYFVARRFDGDQPTTELVMDRNLDQLRKSFRRRGLICFNREPGDDPKILETWL